jgi:rhodanese-related sulfurtransferase
MNDGAGAPRLLADGGQRRGRPVLGDLLLFLLLRAHLDGLACDHDHHLGRRHRARRSGHHQEGKTRDEDPKQPVPARVHGPQGKPIRRSGKVWFRPMPDSLIPPIGSVPPTERMFRVNWVDNLRRTPGGVPFVTPDFTAKQGRRVRVIDVRSAEELTGALGYIPGSEWIPMDRIGTLADRIDRDSPVILVAAGEERSHDAAKDLAAAGMRFVAFMAGGVVAWRDHGYSTTRDPKILDRRDVLRDIGDIPLEPPQTVTAADVEKHVGDPHSVRWIKFPALLVRGIVSCVDGRDDTGVIGSPGGDAGELLVGLRALERMMRRELTDAEIATLLMRRIDLFGRFYMHTDMASSNAAIEAMRADPRFDEALRAVSDPLEWRRFWAAPPVALRPAVLEYGLQPEHIGCGHLRLQLTRAADYGTREGLVQGVLRAFHLKRWDRAPEIELVPLAGGHTERAVLNVRIGGPLLPFSRIPLVSPSVGGGQVFVNHPRVTMRMRKYLAQFLALQSDICRGPIDAEELHVEMERLGSVQLGRTLGELAKGLPIYDVVFNGADKVEVREGGVV